MEYVRCGGLLYSQPGAWLYPQTYRPVGQAQTGLSAPVPSNHLSYKTPVSRTLGAPG